LPCSFFVKVDSLFALSSRQSSLCFHDSLCEVTKTYFRGQDWRLSCRPGVISKSMEIEPSSSLASAFGQGS